MLKAGPGHVLRQFVVLVLAVLAFGDNNAARAQLSADLDGIWVVEAGGVYCLIDEYFTVTVSGDSFKMVQLKGKMRPYETFEGTLSGRQLWGIVTQDWSGIISGIGAYQVPFQGTLERDGTIVLTFEYISALGDDLTSFPVTCTYRRWR